MLIEYENIFSTKKNITGKKLLMKSTMNLLNFIKKLSNRFNKGIRVTRREDV